MLTENENVTQPEVTTTEPEVTTEQEPEVTATEPEVTPEEPEVLTGIVADCRKLNVRKAPAANAPIICTIPVGTEVEILVEESTDEFYYVYTASGVEGFCMRDYIAINS